jgi:hypothetical protein
MSYNVVAVDETQFYNITDDDKVLIEKIESVYFYDPEQITFICSQDKNYYLNYLYTNIIVKKGTSDAELDRLDQTYSCWGENDYFLKRYIDPIPGQVTVELREEETEEELRERLCGNHVL